MLPLSGRPPRAAALSAAALLGLGGALVLGMGLSEPEVAGARTPEAAAPSSAPAPTTAPPDDPPEAAPTSAPAAHFTPFSAVHLLIPAVGLDLPLLGHTPRNGVINPPTLTAGYWIEPYGEPVPAADQADNTLYVAAHSAGRGDDGFDPLLTDDHGGSRLAAGDVVSVRTPEGTVDYTVERTQRYAKDELPAADEVWESSPGRLVLITCFQRADRRDPTENLVVFARS